MKKILIIISFVILFVCIFYLFSFKLEVSFKPLNVSFNEAFNTNDYIVGANAVFLNQELVFDDAGPHYVVLKYQRKNKIYDYPVVFNVQDDTSPLIFASKIKTTYIGEDIDMMKGVICADDTDDDVICNVEGVYNIFQTGIYNLKYKATNSSGLVTYEDVALKVIEKPTDSPKPSEPKKDEFKDIYKKYKSDNTLIGIDVARFQGDIDFEKVKKAGCEFVIIRLGWDVDGEIGLDYNYEKYISDAKEAGLKIGLYFYTEAKTQEDVLKDVKFIVDNMKHEIDLPVAYDWEDFGNYNDYHMSLYHFNNLLYTFIDEVERNKYQGILYSSKYYLNNVWQPNDYKVWLAQYNDIVTYEGSYDVWQITDKGHIDGINHNVDIDILYLNE